MRSEYRQETPTPAFWAGGLDDPGYNGIEGRASKARGSKGGDHDNDRGNGGDRGGKGDWSGGRGKGRGNGSGGGKGKDKDKNGGNDDFQRKDGRYFKSMNGSQICFAFGRNKDGCKKVCPLGRAHVCEFCRQLHRTIECPKNPGWKPPEGKGDARKDA